MVEHTSNAQYTAAGALTSATYGNGVTEYIQYNSRLQPCHAIANTPTLPLVYYGGGGLLGNIYDRVSSYANSASASLPCGPEPGDNGNIAYIADWHNSGHTQSFTYDGLNRLTSAARSDGGYNHTYSYDSFGNLLIQDNINPGPTYSINSTNQLNRYANGNNAYTYDAAGNLVSSGTSDIGGHNFAYNSSSQIVSVDGGATATYLYNGLDERMEKDTPSGWTDYIYLNGQPMAELTSASLWTDYIYANGQKIARIADPYGAPSTVSYYLDDHLGTTQVELDASGNVTWQGQFTPFGSELPDGTTAMHYKFTGKERDAETGLDFFGARFYGSAIGRWVSPDWAEKPEAVPYSKLDDPQSLNLYGYVGNNPLAFTDADGHAPATTLHLCSGQEQGEGYCGAGSVSIQEGPEQTQAQSQTSQASAQATKADTNNQTKCPVDACVSTNEKRDNALAKISSLIFPLKIINHFVKLNEDRKILKQLHEYNLRFLKQWEDGLGTRSQGWGAALDGVVWTSQEILKMGGTLGTDAVTAMDSLLGRTAAMTGSGTGVERAIGEGISESEKQLREMLSKQ